MRKLCCFVLMAGLGPVACGSDQSRLASPLSSTAVTAPAVAATVTPVPTTSDPVLTDSAAPAAPSGPGPNEIVVTGVHDTCMVVGPGATGIVTWRVAVGTRIDPLHMIPQTYHNGHAGCGPTLDGGAYRLTVTGPEDYGIGESGVTTISYNLAEYDCGRVQIDNNANGAITWLTIDYGTDCAPPPPPPPSCKDVTAKISLGPGPGQATAVFHIPQLALIGLASYILPGPNFSMPQENFSFSDKTLPAGDHQLTITLPVGFYQVDAYCGKTHVVTITETDNYGDGSLLDGLISNYTPAE